MPLTTGQPTGCQWYPNCVSTPRGPDVLQESHRGDLREGCPKEWPEDGPEACAHGCERQPGEGRQDRSRRPARGQAGREGGREGDREDGRRRRSRPRRLPGSHPRRSKAGPARPTDSRPHAPPRRLPPTRSPARRLFSFSKKTEKRLPSRAGTSRCTPPARSPRSGTSPSGRCAARSSWCSRCRSSWPRSFGGLRVNTERQLADNYAASASQVGSSGPPSTTCPPPSARRSSRAPSASTTPSSRRHSKTSSRPAPSSSRPVTQQT